MTNQSVIVKEYATARDRRDAIKAWLDQIREGLDALKVLLSFEEKLVEGIWEDTLVPAVSEREENSHPKIRRIIYKGTAPEVQAAESEAPKKRKPRSDKGKKRGKK